MSDSKRTGSRDISELKQRLGLKKGAQPATGQTKANGNTGGVVPPPGLNLPPPPNMAPAQPAIPNAADDPFGAMNAMAAVGKVQRAPEIVIVNDGKPVENVGSKSMGATIAKIAIPAAIALFAGIAVGKIGTGASTYNEGLSDLRTILGDDAKPAPSSVLALKSQLVDVRKVLEEWKDANKFKPSRALEAKLEQAITKIDLKTDKWFSGKSYVEGDIAGKIYSFYGGVAEVKNMFAAHATLAREDDKTFTKSGKYAGLEEYNKFAATEAQIKEGENAFLNGEFRYGVLIHVPTDKDQTPFHAKIVEIGPPYCGGDPNPTTTGKCPDDKPMVGFGWRADPNAGWKSAPPAKGAGDIAADALVLTFPGGVRESLVKSAGGVASEVYYTRRLQAMYDRVHGVPAPNDPERKPVGGLIEEGNKLESAIKTILDQKKERFTFFM